MDDPDWEIRSAAFAALEKLVLKGGGCVTWHDIASGFSFKEETVYFASRPRGIFKPSQMASALSIKTTLPRKSRKPWYDDKFFVPAGESGRNLGLLRYELSKSKSSNLSLYNAWRFKAPLIYFAGVSEAVYQPYFPVWVKEYLEADKCVLVSSGNKPDGHSDIRFPPGLDLPRQVDPSYARILARRRNHQSWFSDRVRTAYGWRCAFSGLPVRDLLVGAHIVADADGGPPSVKNGICMSTLHHAAFDADLVGVDPDCRVRVSSRLRGATDGDLLTALNGLDGSKLRWLPGNPEERPGTEFLERRFAEFLERQG